jgi:hypothetical protein
MNRRHGLEKLGRNEKDHWAACRFDFVELEPGDKELLIDFIRKSSGVAEWLCWMIVVKSIRLTLLAAQEVQRLAQLIRID